MEQRASGELSDEALIQSLTQYEKSVLDIECTFGPDSAGLITSGRGTATKIDESSILTALHVVKGASICNLYSGREFVANTGESRDPDIDAPISIDGSLQDIAVVHSIFYNRSWPELTSVPHLTTPKVTTGQRVCVMSLPLDITSTVQYSCGSVAAALVPGSEGRKDQFTATYIAADGSSGAPIFNSASEIIAVHVAGYDKGQLDLAYAVPLSGDL